MSGKKTATEEALKWVKKLKHSVTQQEQMQAAAGLRRVGVRNRGKVRTRGSISQPASPLVSYRDLEDIIEELKDQPVEVRREVAFALGEVAGEDIVQPLAELAKDAESSVRLIATDAMGKIGGPQAVQSLVMLAKDDPNEDIRALAVEALGALAIQEYEAEATQPMEDMPSRGTVPSRREVRTRGGKTPELPATTDADEFSPERLIEDLQNIGHEDRSTYVRDTVIDILYAIKGR